MRPFKQVDVFTDVPYLGNPLAVVVDGEGLSGDQMQRFATWTNLSETTFLLPPTNADADYRVRIFTTGGELPFAGHPTIGSCHAWIEAGGVAKSDDVVVQECGVGLVQLRRDHDRLAFAAPPLIRSGPVEPTDIDWISRVLRIDSADIVDAGWVDNGPGWVGVLLCDADAVLSLDPELGAADEYAIGVVGPYVTGPNATDRDPSDPAIEVRAFFRLGAEAAEDPVTGSLNASLAQWLLGTGELSAPYVASQGAALNRSGRVHVDSVDGRIWIGGHAITCIDGTVRI